MTPSIGRINDEKSAAVFSILMGLMTGTWILFLLDRFPQARTSPIETAYLLVAEFLASTALIVAGYGIFSHRNWGMPLILVALGELIYCTIRFAGELGQGGSVAGLAFFTSVGAIAIVFAIYLIKSASRQDRFS
jgi:hypothetical protein